MMEESQRGTGKRKSQGAFVARAANARKEKSYFFEAPPFS
jgi:hypothetical protein